MCCSCCRLGGDIYRVPAAGGAPIRLTHTSYPNFSGFSAAAPDGLEIAFSTDRRYSDKCCADLFLMSSDGSHQHLVNSGLTGVQSVSWGPAPSG